MKQLFSKNPWDDFEMFKRNVNTDKFKEYFNFNKGFKYSFWAIFLIGLVLLILWLSTGFYTVQPREEGVELIFGAYNRTSLPGLHYNLPQPIGKTFKVPVTYVNREEVGQKNSNFRGRSEDNAEILMITADENMINVHCEVQWRIKNAYEYLFNIKDNKPGETVRNAAESVIREVVGSKNLEYLIEGVGRQYVADNAHEALQKIVDSYKMGVLILSVQMKSVDPPLKVIDAFRDVQSAKADMEKIVNEALAYKNEILPRAKSEAAKIVAEAESFKIDLINRTNGNVKRLLNIYNEYTNDKTMTKNRIYLDIMGSVIGESKKIILDSNENNFSFLQMNDLFSKFSR